MGLDPQALFSALDLGKGRRLVVAVSGGSDSLALLVLLRNFLPSAAPLLAVTVDHGLRPEAAAEAAAVAALCRELGVGHRTMVWHGEKPATGVSAAAREARYDLLARAARDFGADTVLVAHTMDDQAETVAMRSARGEGAGLAGMADATLFDASVWIARPLLEVRRGTLRDLLSARGIKWFDDPSNENPAYERVRVRAALSDAEVETLAAKARAGGEARTALSERAAHLVDGFATRPAPGLFRLDPEFFAQGGDDSAAAHALRALLAVAGGAARLPDMLRAKMLFSRLRAGPLRATLSRAGIDARRTGVWVRREARNVPAMPLSARAAIWDGRWRIGCKGGPEGLVVAPLGMDRAEALAQDDAPAPKSLARAALSVEPGLFRDGVFVAPATCRDAAALGVSADPFAAPFARFLPGFDLALAAALLHLIGGQALPATPWKHHIAAEA